MQDTFRPYRRVVLDSFRARLAALRGKTSLRAATLSLGWADGYVYRHLDSDTMPLQRINELARVLGVSALDLLTETDVESGSTREIVSEAAAGDIEDEETPAQLRAAVMVA